MAYKYKHFIPQNIAPSGAKHIKVYNANGESICTIPLGRLQQPSKTKRYSFGIVSDTHICPDITTDNTGQIVSARLDKAFTWFENQGVAFVAHCGDIVNVGFENPAGTYNPAQFIEYKRIRDLHPNLAVYASAGNHESGSGNQSSTAHLMNYLDEYKEYTGHDLNFTVEQGGDVFIFLGMPKINTLYVSGSTLPVPELAWLESQLSANADKRCFVFIHPYIVGDSGDTLGANENDLIPESGYVTNIIKNALKNHGRAILFHGHSHFMPHMQEVDKLTNYTEKNGFPSVHVSSLGWAADVSDDGEIVKHTSEGFGSLVDVYDDHIIITAWDFERDIPAPHGTIKINY